MAGGKETPRQKMIGLMYLVLMAMLAMNVSKEIINAFVTLDEKMASGNDLTRGGISRKVADVKGVLAEMKSVDTTPKENIAKQEALVAQLDHVLSLGKEMANFYVGRTSYMIMESDPTSNMLAETLGHYDNLAPNEYYYEDAAGYYHLASMSHLLKKDDYDTPTRLFVGDNHKTIVPEGMEIVDKMLAYRDALCKEIAEYEELVAGKPHNWTFTPPTVTLHSVEDEDVAKFEAALDASLQTVNPKDADKVRQIYKILTPPDMVGNHDEVIPWVAGVFDHSPVVASGALFTSLKGDVERAEAIAVDLIASKSKKPKFNFNKIEVIPFANKGYINQGDSLTLSVMVAAYDSTQDLKLEYWLDDSTRSEANKKTFVRSADPKSSTHNNKLGLGEGAGPGRHFVYGNMEIEENGAKKWKRWNFDYTIGTPTGTVANKEMNVLYIGYDNQIVASGSGYPSSEASCSGCSLSKKGDGEYVATVKGGKEATIVVHGIDAEGKKTEIARQPFRIKRLPDPTPVIVGTGVGSSTVKIGKIKQAKTLLAELKGSPLNVKFTITKFTVSVVKNGQVAEAKCKGNKLSGKAKNFIQGLKKGQKIYIEEVYAKGPKGGAKKIPPLIFKVI